MKNAAIILVILALALFGQSGDRFGAGSVDTDPSPIPATLTTVFDFTFYADEITLTNKSAGSVTVTIQDRQSTPREFMKDVPIPASALYVVSLHGRKFPGGLSWSASSANAVIGYVQGRR